MSETFQGKITITYNIFCSMCDSHDHVDGFSRKQFVVHVRSTGWECKGNKWYCEHCITSLIALEEAIKKEYHEHYKHSYAPKPQKRFGLNAFKLGWESAHKNHHENSCPYPDHRTDMGRVTFSRSYRRLWFKGRDEYFKWESSL